MKFRYKEILELIFLSRCQFLVESNIFEIDISSLKMNDFLRINFCSKNAIRIEVEKTKRTTFFRPFVPFYISFYKENTYILMHLSYAKILKILFVLSQMVGGLLFASLFYFSRNQLRSNPIIVLENFTLFFTLYLGVLLMYFMNFAYSLGYIKKTLEKRFKIYFKPI